MHQQTWNSEELSLLQTSTNMANQITIATWNIRGLCDLNRKHTIHNWLKALPKLPDILCLQEIKANHFRLDHALNFIFPDSNQIIAPSNDTCGGTALLL